MKKFICGILLVLLCFESFMVAFAFDGSKCKIYAPDGRSASIARSQLDSYKALGWYDYPVSLLYATDGRSIVVASSDIPAWENVGWIDAKKNITIYAVDGRRAVIPLWQLESYKALGWYDYPVVMLYAAGGKTAVIGKYAEADWLSVGWSRFPVFSKDDFKKKVEGWWVNLDHCKDIGFDGGVSLEFINFSTNDFCMGATYSEAWDYNLKSLTHIGNGEYEAVIYSYPSWYVDEYYKASEFKWRILYTGEDTIDIYSNGKRYTYTYIGKYHNYDSIQRHPLVVAATRA